MGSKVYVAGVGMIPFTKPGTSETYDIMGSKAIKLAVEDAGIAFDDIQEAYAGYVYGDSCSGQKAIYAAGMSGIPIINVNNNCSTGSSALYLARRAVEAGMVDCALAVGFEEMQPGALGTHFTDRPNPLERFDQTTDNLVDVDLPMALRYFGGAGLEHMRRYGTRMEDFAAVRAKASRHAANNPLSIFRAVVTSDDVMNDKVMWPGVMTRLMACPPTCGAAAVIVASEDFMRRHGVDRQVRIAAQIMTTDRADTFDSGNMLNLVGFEMAKRASTQAYDLAGVGPEDIPVVELHDCFAHNEVVSYESLGLCPEGGAQKFIADGDNSYGGKFVTNPSGGLLSKGHPLGATGIAQCYELVHQLRGTAGARQVENARHALQHNLGLGGACVVTIYEKC